MNSGLVQDKIFNALIETLSIEELQTILNNKKRQVVSRPEPQIKLNPMTKKQKLKEYYRNLMIQRKMLYKTK